MSAAELTVGMMTYDDFHGVYMTLQHIVMAHSAVMPRLKFLVIDNNPDGKHSKAVRDYLSKFGKQADYCAVRGSSSTSYRNLVFELATTEHVLCLDCHVHLYDKAIERLLRFYQKYPACHDLLQGPMLNENLSVHATEMDPYFRGWNFGTWKNQMEKGYTPDADPFEIPMHGMALFACSRVGWPRFTSGMRMFGAEEGTIHEKFRRLGRKTYCMPFLGWVHRFGRPDGVPYPNQASQKLRNYLLTFNEVGLPRHYLETYFIRHLHSDPAQAADRMQELLAWADTLPPSPLPPAAEDYKPFLGREIKILD